MFLTYVCFTFTFTSLFSLPLFRTAKSQVFVDNYYTKKAWLQLIVSNEQPSTKVM